VKTSRLELSGMDTFVGGHRYGLRPGGSSEAMSSLADVLTKVVRFARLIFRDGGPIGITASCTFVGSGPRSSQRGHSPYATNRPPLTEGISEQTALPISGGRGCLPDGPSNRYPSAEGRIRKSSIRLPDRSCFLSQRGCFPRPAQVSVGASGFLNFGKTRGYGRRRGASTACAM
jgi:hypothetical protein